MQSLATKRSIRPSSSRSAATTPRPRPSRSMMPGLGRHVDEPARVVAEDMVGKGRDRARVASDVNLARGVLAELGVVGVPDAVVADVEVEVAVVVQVGEGRRGRPVAVAAQPRLPGSRPRTCRRPGCDRGHRTAIG